MRLAKPLLFPLLFLAKLLLLLLVSLLVFLRFTKFLFFFCGSSDGSSAVAYIATDNGIRRLLA